MHDTGGMELQERDPTIIVVSGMQGAGKSTVAALLTSRFTKGAYVPADELQRMIRRGGAWPEDREMSDEALHQLRLRLRNLCLLGRSFRDAGFTAVLDDIVIGLRVDDLLEELRGETFAFVMLTPNLESVIEREKGRGTALHEVWAWMDAEIRERTQRIGLWLDTSAQTPEETVDEVMRRLDEAVVEA